MVEFIYLCPFNIFQMTISVYKKKPSEHFYDKEVWVDFEICLLI